ncbi:MAG: hypothetical protein JWR24_3199 [Actinoallomurus sp.]|nr:hypothetical protein [Actinoallomurus sp.]
MMYAVLAGLPLGVRTCRPGQWKVHTPFLASHFFTASICAMEKTATMITYGAKALSTSTRESSRPARRSNAGSGVSAEPPAITGVATVAPSGLHTRLSRMIALAETSAAKMSHSL